MFNVIIATHGQLSKEFLNVLQSFFGSIEKVDTIGLGSQGIDDFSMQIDQIVTPLLKKPVIVFCDIAGGTPFNEFAKRSILWQNEFYLFGGVSLPVLVETLNLRMQNKSLSEVSDRIQKLTPLTKFEIKAVKGDDDE